MTDELPGGAPPPPPAPSARAAPSRRPARSAVARLLPTLAALGFAAAWVLGGGHLDPGIEVAETGEQSGDPNGAGATDPTPPTQVREQIAFMSTRDGPEDIFLVSPDGSGLRNLTRHPAQDWHPTWSSDRTEIAFSSDRGGRAAIYSVRVADGVVRQLTDGGQGGDYEPAWSPDGTTVAFSRLPDDSPDQTRDLFAVGADGSGLRQLTDQAGNDYWPAWAPDGTRIAFTSDRDGTLDVFVMAPDGTDLHNLTADAADYFQPDWSPDGERMVFDRMEARDPFRFGIMVMQADGSDLRPLFDTVPDDYSASFSPDGRFLVFGSARNAGNGAGGDALYVVDAAGSGTPIRISEPPADDRSPTW